MNKDTIIEQMVDDYSHVPYDRNEYRNGINAALSNPQLMEAAGWVKKEEKLDYMLQKRFGTEWHDLPNQKEGNEVDGIYRKVPLASATHPQEPTPNVLDELEKWAMKKAVTPQDMYPFVLLKDLLTKIQSLRNQQQ